MNDIEKLYPDAPAFEDIIGVERLNIQVEVKTESEHRKYVTPPFHFMVYKKDPTFSKGLVYECACLELGRFHVIGSDSYEIDGKIIKRLIDELLAIIADHIRINIFEHKNDSLFLEVQSEYMNEFWKLYRMYKLHQTNFIISEKTLQQQSSKASKNIVQAHQDKTPAEYIGLKEVGSAMGVA